VMISLLMMIMRWAITRHTDLQRLFGNSNANIIREILHRFDGLPIHKLVYYLSYNQGVHRVRIRGIPCNC
jgi:hypothetical protein